MDKFLEKHNYQINTRKTENPNSPVSTKEVEFVIKEHFQGFPGGAVVENLPANAGDAGSSPGLEGSHMPRSN